MKARFRASQFRGCILLFVLLAIAVYHAIGQPARTSPPFAGEKFPDPPQQKEPWTPPKTKLPKVLLGATSALFDAGLADPRGGEYCQVKVSTGSVWSGRTRSA